MNAPAPMNIFLTLDQLEPSKTNPRKRFDPKKLAELASSVKTQGILEPLLVRPIGDATTRFEIVAGERRYRAAQIAGLNDVPCYVRHLTDIQVLHAQVIENLQRDGLHPLEEAEGFERLLQQKDGYTADSIGAEIGKSRAYVYAKLKLLDLCAEAREAFLDDRLEESTALLIARIPVAKLQIEAVSDIAANGDDDEDDEGMSFRTARDHIQRHYMLELKDVPWSLDDAKLLPTAGNCAGCTKRTGNQPDLFDDVKNKDVCTDTVCFGMKKTAYILELQKQAEQEGHQVVKGKAAEKMFPNSHQLYPIANQLSNKGLAEVDDPIPGDKQKRTWGEVLASHNLLAPAPGAKKPPVKKTLIEDPHNEGDLLQTINIEDATKALREAGFVITPMHEAKTAKARQESAAQKKLREEQQAEVARAKDYRMRLFKGLRTKIEDDLQQGIVADGLSRILAEFMFEQFAGYQGAQLLAPFYGIADEGHEAVRAFESAIPTMTAQQRFLLMIDTLCSDELNIGDWQAEDDPEIMLDIAGELGIDVQGIKEQMQRETGAMAEAAPTEDKKSGKKAKKGGAA